MRYPGYLNVACARPEVRIGDVSFNQKQLSQQMAEAARQGVDLLLTPALSLTGASCGDLFRQPFLQQQARQALHHLAEESAAYPVLATLVGLPAVLDGHLQSTVALLQAGKIVYWGPIPSPQTQIFYSDFSKEAYEIDLPLPIPFSRKASEARDWAYPSSLTHEYGRMFYSLAIAGPGQLSRDGLVVLHPSEESEHIGGRAYRSRELAQQSALHPSLHLYAAPGVFESTTDLVFSGAAVIAAEGQILQDEVDLDFRPQPFRSERVSLSALAFARDRLGLGLDNGLRWGEENGLRREDFALPSQGVFRQAVNPHPFLPSPGQEEERCEEILRLQAAGLARRLLHMGTTKIVMGLSGGLDSTLALLVADRAIQALEGNASDLIAVTLPGFGTSGRTYNNALKLAGSLHADLREISIVPAVRQHFNDIGHDPEKRDVTYENAQARERTQILMDLANQEGALMLGTGDLSEIALGWCTYNGDHMSMYGVNSCLPKTLLSHLVSYCAQVAEKEGRQELADTLRSIVETPISPELLPTDQEGNIAQKTEDSTGPYELHDFFLYHMLRHGREPAEILFLAEKAFDHYSRETLRHWLEVFLRRFFSQQFKRSCSPDGPGIGSISLSPRGYWSMPSDMSAQFWIDSLRGWED